MCELTADAIGLHVRRPEAERQPVQCRQIPIGLPVAGAVPAELLAPQLPAGDIIADPFLGSGTTMIAAEKLGRVCYGMKIEPRYVDVAVRRWEEMTGNKAELVESNG